MSDHDELPDEYSEEELEDVIDSEEEEDEELEDDHHRRPKKRNRNTFLLDEAEVDDDDEEEEEEEEFGESGFVNEDLPDDEEIGYKGASRHQQLDRRRFRDEEINAEELAAQLRERYSRDDYASGGRRGNIEHVTERMKLPDVKGPKLWMIKCKPGKEWDVVNHIIKKCLTGRFDVLSAFARDSLKGYVYIEARQPAAAQKYIYIGTGRSNGRCVEVSKKETQLKPRSWVRIRRGKYLNDLAQVLEISESDEQAGMDDSAKRKVKSRPPQRLFNPEIDNGMKDILPGRGNTFVHGADTYRDGFLEKRVKLSALIVDDVNATLEEISKFAANDQEDEDGVLGTTADIVIYAGNGVRLPLDTLSKRFQQGDHVKVINGRYKDETGLIVKVAESIINVFSKDLREAGDVTTAQTTVSPFDLHDYVEFLNNQDVGIVVKVGNESLAILREDGQVGSVKPHQVTKPKRDLRRAVASDADGNVVRVGDKVKEVGSSSREVTKNSGVFIVRGQQVRSMANTGARQALANDKFARPAPPIDRGHGRYNQRNDRLIGQTVVITQGKDKGLLGIVKECTSTGARVELHSNARVVAIDKAKLHVKTSTGGTIPALEFSPNMPGTSVAPSYTSAITSGSNRPGSGYSGMGAQTPFISSGGGRTPNPYGSAGSSGSRTPAWDAGNRTPAWNAGNRTPAWNSGNQTPAWSGGGGGSSTSSTSNSTSDHWGSSSHTTANGSDGWGSVNANSSGHDGWGSTVATPNSSDQWGTPNTSSHGTSGSSTANRGWEDSSSSTFPSTPGPMTPAPATPGSTTQTPRFPSTPGPHTPATQAAYLESGDDRTSGTNGGVSGADRRGQDYGGMGDGEYDTENDVYNTAWPLEGIWVKIIPKHRVTGQPWLNGNEGEEATILQVHANGNSTIRLLASQQVIPQVPRDYLARVTPERKDTVAFLTGRHRGNTGVLMGVDNTDCYVQGSNDVEYKFCKLAMLAKYTAPA
ncbi:hypothetical protein BDF22DRAFT_745680 [Syncephalis plumigaleata]|nr:hypothetical protein BDF22DRAFT_745680 [Syncephalis plumigaleata]